MSPDATHRTVLIGDDDPQVCAMIELALRKYHMGARRADSIKSIESAVKTERVDVVLLDIVLGPENGWEALRLLRRHSDVPVILMTGANVDDEVRLEARELGALAIINKPFEIQELMDLIHSAFPGPESGTA